MLRSAAQRLRAPQPTQPLPVAVLVHQHGTVVFAGTQGTRERGDRIRVEERKIRRQYRHERHRIRHLRQSRGGRVSRPAAGRFFSSDEVIIGRRDVADDDARPRPGHGVEDATQNGAAADRHERLRRIRHPPTTTARHDHGRIRFPSVSHS